MRKTTAKNTGEKILIVEDETSLRKILCDSFKRAGYKVFEARDGQEGLSQASENHPDLILLDTLMPSMDGATMVRQLRKTGSKDVPVMFISNLSNEEQVRLMKHQDSRVLEIHSKDQISLDFLIQRVRFNLRPQGI